MEEPLDVDLPEPSHLSEVFWIDPYPDVLLDDAMQAPGPEARYERTEAISLAFVTAFAAVATAPGGGADPARCSRVQGR
jgi:hypothetical protein